MSRVAKISRGSWCMSFGFKNPATLDQTIKVLGAFNYDGIELGGFFDHATLERFPTKQSRQELATWVADNGMVVAGVAYGPYGDLGRLPWATGDETVLKEYLAWFDEFLQFCVDVGSPALRVDPGSWGPMPYGTDYNATYARVVEVFSDHAQKGADVGVKMLWEAECPQPFNKPSEVIRIMTDVTHPNFQMLYDTGHFYGITTLAFNQVRPAETLEGGQEELIKALKGRIGHVHLSDTDGLIAGNLFATKLGLGRGFIDFETLVPLLADCYDGEWWSVDSIPMGPDAWADSYEDVFTLNDLLDRHVRSRTA